MPDTDICRVFKWLQCQELERINNITQAFNLTIFNSLEILKKHKKNKHIDKEMISDATHDIQKSFNDN